MNDLEIPIKSNIKASAKNAIIYYNAFFNLFFSASNFVFQHYKCYMHYCAYETENTQQIWKKKLNREKEREKKRPNSKIILNYKKKTNTIRFCPLEMWFENFQQNSKQRKNRILFFVDLKMRTNPMSTCKFHVLYISSTKRIQTHYTMCEYSHTIEA